MSVVGLVFRIQVHRTEADATYLLAGTILLTYASRIESLAKYSLSRSLIYFQHHRRRSRSHVHLHALLPRRRERFASASKMHPLGTIYGIMDVQIKPSRLRNGREEKLSETR